MKKLPRWFNSILNHNFAYDKIFFSGTNVLECMIVDRVPVLRKTAAKISIFGLGGDA